MKRRLLSASELEEGRRSLPIWAVRRELLQAIASVPTLVLTGETGCGKTTQIPQFLQAAGYATHGIIGVTQPRRVAAMSVAQRVADEQGVTLGREVGYCVRFDDTSGKETRILYMTDGMLLRAVMADPTLSRYSVLVVDEAHERSLQTDMVLSVVKSVQVARAGGKRPLKLMVMSATLETDTFCEYFGTKGPIQVEGRQFPVQMMYAPEPQDDYVEAAVTTVLQIHMHEAKGDILVFLTGQVTT